MREREGDAGREGVIFRFWSTVFLRFFFCVLLGSGNCSVLGNGVGEGKKERGTGSGQVWAGSGFYN